MAEPNRSRSQRLRKAVGHADAITRDVQRNNVAAEAVLTEIEDREARTASRNTATSARRP